MAQLEPPPELLADLAARWGLAIGTPLAHDGFSSWVARVRHGDERFVLKLTAAHNGSRDESRDEAAGLRAWNGNGMVRLVDEHTAGTVTALLLEDCAPGTALSSRPPEAQDEVLAGLLRRLWVDPPSDPPFRPLADMCGWWADAAAARGVPDEFARGLELFRTLPLDAPTTRLLTTDLHAGNVLAAEREPWLAVDPKPYVGDPTYDALCSTCSTTRRGCRPTPAPGPTGWPACSTSIRTGCGAGSTPAACRSRRDVPLCWRSLRTSACPGCRASSGRTP